MTKDQANTHTVEVDMQYKKINMSFKSLGPSDEREFRQHARDTYEPFSNIEGVWHPVYQDECVLINKEHADYVKEA